MQKKYDFKNKKVRKVIIPAAGWGTRMLPATKAIPKEMLTIVDKPLAQLLVEEAAAAGIEEVIFITADHKVALQKHFESNVELEGTLKGAQKWELLVKSIESQNLVKKIHWVVQGEAKGLGHAIGMAKSIVGKEPVAVMLGDDLITNDGGLTPIHQCIHAFQKTGRPIIGVQTVLKSVVHKYGVINPKKKTSKSTKLVEMKGFIEKPTAEEAPSRMAALGRYVLTPDIFDLLVKETVNARTGEIQLTDSIEKSMKYAPTYAFEFKGERYDCGSKVGYVKATIDIALKHEETRDEIRKYINKLFVPPETKKPIKKKTTAKKEVVDKK